MIIVQWNRGPKLDESQSVVSKGETNRRFCTAQYPCDVDFASSLARLWVQYYTSRSGTDKWHDPNVRKPQYTEDVYGRSHFPGPEKYKKTSLNVTISIFIHYYYADTVPLRSSWRKQERELQCTVALLVGSSLSLAYNLVLKSQSLGIWDNKWTDWPKLRIRGSCTWWYCNIVCIWLHYICMSSIMSYKCSSLHSMF